MWKTETRKRKPSSQQIGGLPPTNEMTMTANNDYIEVTLNVTRTTRVLPVYLFAEPEVTWDISWRGGVIRKGSDCLGEAAAMSAYGR